MYWFNYEFKLLHKTKVHKVLIILFHKYLVSMKIIFEFSKPKS